MNAEKKTDFKKPAHYFPGGSNPAQQGTSGEEYEFDISRVQCWACGDYGHFADHCPNEPLPVESQTVLRKTIRAEKRRSRRNWLGRQVSTQNPLTILKNNQNQGTSNTNENPIRSPSPHVLHAKYYRAGIRIRTRQGGIGNSSHGLRTASRDRATDTVGARLGSTDSAAPGGPWAKYRRRLGKRKRCRGGRQPWWSS